ncbi:hypothetical protein Cni_G10115 [Canna indica]|uniref:Ubiquitin-like protease family profile domain-containing protein n=1 Tax=Canna indica TaxID=4628 RepID=A0AAQ3K589_9LILI|nr:hypothetical protein Cni_G10115 [Canna indica]
MRDFSQKDLRVFDFGAEEEAVEAAASRFSAPLQTRLRPRMNESVNKCHFLETFAPGLSIKHDASNILCIDINERGNNSAPYSIDAPEQGLTLNNEKEELDGIVASSTTNVEHGQMCPDEHEDGALIRNDTSDGMEVDVISEDEDSSSMMTGTYSSPSNTAEDEGRFECPEMDDYCAATGDALDNQIAVVISSDYVIHGSVLYGESQLVFSADCVKIECSDASGDDEKFSSELAVSDLICIDSRWSASVTTALVKLCARSNDMNMREKHYNGSDVLKVIFSINDMRWLEKEQKIRNLAARYKDIWNFNSGDMWEYDSVGPNTFFSRDHFTEITDSFEDVVYPKGDPDAVSISKRDIDLLQPETFINDTIIDFYIKYLKNKIQPDQKHRFHFFNSFFFRKLADLDKDRGNVSEGRAAFLRVRKWTRKVNIFEKDYIFIPVNFNLHWSLLVICHPGEIVKSEDSETDCNKVPCILHMDSIKGSHSGLKNIIQSYIWEEWKERHPEASEDDSSKFLNLRFVSLEVPQQENSFDCGLFLLHYVELFLEKTPMNFDPFKITKFCSFLSADWFLPSEASLKRTLIRKLIYELLNDSSEKVNPITSSNEHPTTSGYPANNIEQEQHVELLPACCSPSKDVDALYPVTEDGAELLTASANCDKKAGLMLPEFEAGSNAIPLPQNGEHANHHTATSSNMLFPSCSTAEHADVRKLVSSISLEKEDCRHTEFCSSSSLDDVGVFVTTWNTVDETGTNVDPSECNDTNEMKVNKRGEPERTSASLDDIVSPWNTVYETDNVDPTPDSDNGNGMNIIKEGEPERMSASLSDGIGAYIAAPPWCIVGVTDASLDHSESNNANDINVNTRCEPEKASASPDNICSSLETPSSSFREKLDDFVEDSQEVETTKAEGSGCEDSTMTRIMEADCQIVDDGRETRTNVCKVVDICRVPSSAGAEDGDDGCDEIDPNEIEGMDGEHHQEIGSEPVRLDDESHEISSSMEVNNGDANCQTNIPCSFEGIIIADDDEDKSLDKDDVQVIGKRLVQHTHKRRKIMVPEGTRRRTRSFTRESHSES